MQVTERCNEDLKKNICCHECSSTKEVRTIFVNNPPRARRRGINLCEDCIDILAGLLTQRI
ncbi:MAG: hypothetical protein ACUZ8I_18075 [Candidatus Scalindua sp.]